MLILVLRRIGGALLVLAGVGVATAVALAFVPAPDDTTILARIGNNLRIFFTLDYAGRTLNENLPVLDVLLDRAGKSFLLIGGGLVIAALLGIPTGIAAALRPHHRGLRWWRGLLHGLSALPILVLGYAFVLVATEQFDLPPFRQALSVVGGGAAFFIYLLPMLTLAVGDGLLSDLIRTIEAETVHIREQDWFRAARARGLKMRRHLAHSLAAPIATTLANKLAYLISGSVVVEYVFGWQGLGYLILNALVQAGPKDYALVLAATTLFVGVVVLLHLCSTFVALATNPRLREA